MADITEANLNEIIEPAISPLKGKANSAYTLLVTKVKEGFFETHQSTGKIKGITEQLIEASKELRPR